MPTTASRLIALFLSTMSVAPAMARDVPALPDQPHIVVVGEGEAQAEADYLELRISVILTAESASGATEQVEHDLLAVVNALLESKIERDDIVINAVSLDVEYNYDENPPTIEFVEASRTIDVTLHDIGRYDEVARIAIAHGANAIARPTLRSKRESDLAELAEQRAIRDARRRAESLAAGFGRSLGAVYGIASPEARQWRYRGGTRFGTPEADPNAIEALIFTPRPVVRRTVVYGVFLLGPPVDSE